MTRAFAYLRVSGKGQVKGDGFPRQLKAIREYARTHNIRIAKTYRDEGVNGSTPSTNRPAFTAMLAALHGNGVTTIIVERLDRLARDLVVQETILADLAKHGFKLISVAVISVL